jgi:hypothetical protein
MTKPNKKLPHAVTNQEFLDAVFGTDESARAHVTSFSNDPSDIAKEFRSACWGGGSAKQRLANFAPAENQYFCISLFADDAEGKARRRKALFDACFVIVADDVAEKVPVENAEKLPPPSYKLLTSAGSQQWGWILDEACESRAQVTNLLDGLVAQGLAPEGIDPGMKGVTRYVRLPAGSNTKAKRLDAEGNAFKCQMLEWEPDRLYSMDEMAKAFAIDIYAQNNDQGTSLGLNSDNHIVKNHPILKHVNVTGTGADGWIKIDCVNAENHTGEDASGAAVQILPDGRVNYMCHHGHCGGDENTKKVTGPEAVKILNKQIPGFSKDYDNYQVDIKASGLKHLQEAALAMRGSDQDIDELLTPAIDPDGMNPLDYVFMKSTNTYYELKTGTELSPSALDAIYLPQHTGRKGDPKASMLYNMVMERETMCADGFIWHSDVIKPTPKRLVNNGTKRVVNEWEGLALTPVKGDVEPWLDLLAFLVPNEKERLIVTQWLANLFLDIGNKPQWQLIHRGSLRNGKDSLYKPIAQIFGSEGAADIRGEDIDNGWGDVFYGRKLLIFQEIKRPQDRGFSNKLKTYAASTSTGVTTYNIKGKGVRQAADTMGFVGMSNYHACLALDPGERRYFVFDSFFQPKEEDYYTKYHQWLNNGGASALLHHLINDVDMTGFDSGRLPYVTKAALEMTELGKSDYAQVMCEQIEAQLGCFSSVAVTLPQVKAQLEAQGNKMGRNGIAEALITEGYRRYRGTRKVDGKVAHTPRYFTTDNLDGYSPGELYDYWLDGED